MTTALNALLLLVGVPENYRLGVGSGGGNLARVCKTGFGMTVLGMTQMPREMPHVDRAFGRSGLLSVLPEADFVVLCLACPRPTWRCDALLAACGRAVTMFRKPT